MDMIGSSAQGSARRRSKGSGPRPVRSNPLAGLLPHPPRAVARAVVSTTVARGHAGHPRKGIRNRMKVQIEALHRLQTQDRKMVSLERKLAALPRRKQEMERDLNKLEAMLQSELDKLDE